MGCAACGRGFHAECRQGCKKCHPTSNVSTAKVKKVKDLIIAEPKKLNLKDEKSTGRKRAAQLYPIDPDAPCEWRGQRNCGGGRFPIIGCYAGKQKHRHHGPIKRPTRNERGNVHRICTACHVHWHELNDLEYDEKDYELLPHLPTDCDDATILLNEAEWRSGAIGKKYKLASSENKKKKLDLHEDE